jgi:hypothetical protein
MDGSGSPGSLYIVTDGNPGDQKTNESGTLQKTIDITLHLDMIFICSFYKTLNFYFIITAGNTRPVMYEQNATGFLWSWNFMISKVGKRTSIL